MVAAQAQHLEHEAHSHAQAQTELTVQAQPLAPKAQAHAHAQVAPLPVAFAHLPCLNDNIVLLHGLRNWELLVRTQPGPHACFVSSDASHIEGEHGL